MSADFIDRGRRELYIDPRMTSKALGVPGFEKRSSPPLYLRSPQSTPVNYNLGTNERNVGFEV